MGVLATLALFAWMALMMLFLLGKFQPGVRTAAAEPVKGDKESFEEWTARYLAWRCKQRRQLIKTAILLNPDIDLEDVSPPLKGCQVLHRSAVLEGAIWGYVKTLDLVNHVLECENTSGSEKLRRQCFSAGWVDDPDAKLEEKEPPQTTNATIEKLRAQCKQMGLPDECLVSIGAKTLEVVLERFGAQCIACRRWRLRDRVTIEQYEDTDGNGRALKRFGVAHCQPSCDTTWPWISVTNGHKMVNKARAKMIRTGGVSEVVISAKSFAPGGVIKPGGRV